MSIVEIKNMSFSYNGNIKVLNNINIRIEEKDFVCIVGENGSGKTSLVKCILGLNAGYEGDVGTIVEAFAASWIEILPALQPSC